MVNYGGWPQCESYLDISCLTLLIDCYLLNIDANLVYFPERRVSASSLDPRVKELTDENEKIHKQNNLLTLKVELLLDMLAQKTAEADILTKDMEKMKAILLAVHPTRKQ